MSQSSVNSCAIRTALRPHAFDRAILGLMRLSLYSPCNADESLLVACGVAQDFLPKINAIYAAKWVLGEGEVRA